MRGADTGEVGQRGLDDLLVVSAGQDAFLDSFGEGGVLAVAVAVGVILAAGKCDPGVETTGQNVRSRSGGRRLRSPRHDGNRHGR